LHIDFLILRIIVLLRLILSLADLLVGLNKKDFDKTFVFHQAEKQHPQALFAQGYDGTTP